VKWIGVLCVVLALLAGGCGGGDDDEAATTAAETAAATETGETSEVSGADVFASAGCGNCHTLAAAGSAGSVGPNLDDLVPSQETVAEQVRNGGGGMPAFADQLSDAEIDAVARFVADSAGQ
jgi:mono/diheme cytochrome c family protein